MLSTATALEDLMNQAAKVPMYGIACRLPGIPPLTEKDRYADPAAEEMMVISSIMSGVTYVKGFRAEKGGFIPSTPAS